MKFKKLTILDERGVDVNGLETLLKSVEKYFDLSVVPFKRDFKYFEVILIQSLIVGINGLDQSFKRRVENLSILGSETSYKYITIMQEIREQPFDVAKLETSISKDPNYSYLYAKHYLRSRFRQGERSITLSPFNKKRYLSFLQNINNYNE